jgi:hypothetical protein
MRWTRRLAEASLMLAFTTFGPDTLRELRGVFAAVDGEREVIDREFARRTNRGLVPTVRGIDARFDRAIDHSLEARDGARWKQRIEQRPPLREVDGQVVCVLYNTGTAACYDLDGNRKWIKYLEKPVVGSYGISASPVLAGHVGRSGGGLA